MAAVEVTISGVLYDKVARTTQPVVLIGEATLTGLGVGGGPIIPPPQEKPPHIWGGGNEPFPTPPIPVYPGGSPDPPRPPTGTPGDDGFIKPPPAEGGWAYHKEYNWGYYPKPGDAGPK